MRKTLRLAALFVCALSVVACDDDKPIDTPVNHNNYEMANTTWQGSYDSPVQDPDGGTITFTLLWTMDFLTEDSGRLLCEISSAVSQPQYQDINFTYRTEGTTGYFVVDGQEDSFAIDWSNNKISMDLQMPIDIGTGRMLVGGMTDLYRIR